MSSVAISVIMPTLGRPTLRRALRSVRPYLGPEDEVLVIGDGDQPAARAVVSAVSNRQIRYFEHHEPGSTYGNAQRNFGMHMAKGDYFAFLDDDDRFLPNALASIRREAVREVPLIFRRQYKRTISWTHPKFIKGEIGTGMFSFPVRGAWVDCPLTTDEPGFTDFLWIQQVVALWPPDAVRWCEDIIYWCMSHGGGK